LKRFRSPLTAAPKASVVELVLAALCDNAPSSEIDIGTVLLLDLNLCRPLLLQIELMLLLHSLCVWFDLIHCYTLVLWVTKNLWREIQHLHYHCKSLAFLAFTSRIRISKLSCETPAYSNALMSPTKPQLWSLHNAHATSEVRPCLSWHQNLSVESFGHRNAGPTPWSPHPSSYRTPPNCYWILWILTPCFPSMPKQVKHPILLKKHHGRLQSPWPCRRRQSIAITKEFSDAFGLWCLTLNSWLSVSG